MLERVIVRRMLISEKDRRGIGTFQPKDEKNQDSTELTGDINYRLIAEYGSDSDPRAFNFDGEFNVANRGIIEFVEILNPTASPVDLSDYHLADNSAYHTVTAGPWTPSGTPQTDFLVQFPPATMLPAGRYSLKAPTAPSLSSNEM